MGTFSLWDFKDGDVRFGFLFETNYELNFEILGFR